MPSGLSPSVARRMGIELPDGKGKCRDKVAKETVSVDSKPKAKRGGTRKRVVADGGNGSPGSDDEQGVIEPSSGVPGVGVTGVGGPVPLPAMDITDLGGRTGSEVEIVRWVARNMEMLSPDVDGCPDATAWGLLAHCRRSELARAEFWKQTYPKLLPSKAQLETTVEVDMDGSGTVELIGRIRAMRESAEGDGT